MTYLTERQAMRLAERLADLPRLARDTSAADMQGSTLPSQPPPGTDLRRIDAGRMTADTLAAPTLPHAPRPHDMPPKWDGHRVEWEGWQVPPASTMRFHAPPECCARCGSLAEPLFNWGRAWSAPGEVAPFRRPKSYADAAANQRARRDGTCLGLLAGFRCPDCRHDSVLDQTKSGHREWFDLDDSDYADEGSWPA